MFHYLLFIFLIIIIINYYYINIEATNSVQSESYSDHYQTPLIKSKNKTVLPNNFDNIKQSEKDIILMNNITNNNFKNLFLNNDILQQYNHTFSNKINIKSDITNQKYSGRCWIFAFLNMLRLDMIKIHDLTSDFELSSTYLFFYDKLEKSQLFLQNIYKTKHLPLNNRTVQFLIVNKTAEGGTWNFLCNLIKKYGVIPKSNMKDTLQSNNSKYLNKILNQNLLNIAIQIRSGKIPIPFHLYLKQKMTEIYKLLLNFLGNPPQKFDWEYYRSYNNTKVKESVTNLTPLLFSKKYLDFKSEDWVICANCPLNKYPFYQTYRAKYCNNMVDGIEKISINLPIRQLILLAKKSIDNEDAVWFSCDFNQYYHDTNSILDPELFNDKHLYNIPINQYGKGLKLSYGINSPNHAMLLLGYNLKGKYIDKWLIENSHGTHDSKKNSYDQNGYITMSTKWFTNYVYEIVVKKSICNQKILNSLKIKPKLLEPWDNILGCDCLSD